MKTVFAGRATTDAPRLALRDLRSARRAHRLQDIHWSDSIYRLYIVFGGGGFLLWWIVTLLGTPKLGAHTREQVLASGPAAAGLLVALAMGGALRSGSRGGPLSLEGADVTHVMQSPIPRRLSLGRPYVHQLRRGVYIGGLAGVAIGACTRPFLLGPVGGWIATGAGFGGLLGVAFTGIAAIASGRGLGRRPASAAMFALLAWALADLLGKTVSSPTTLIGSGLFYCLPNKSGLSVAPILGLVALAVLAACTAIFGRIGLGGTSLEQAERRTALVGELRFAVTTQDLRAALLLRRQLAAERPRQKPWFNVKSGVGLDSAIRVRALRGIARWPLSRVLRVVLNAAVAGAAARMAWEHTIPLVIIPGVALYLVALDACETMAQDVDHPDLAAMMPRHRGRMANRQTIVPFVVVGIVGALSGVFAFLTGLAINSVANADAATLGVCVVVGIVGGLTATAGAALSLVIGPPPFSMMLQTPELAVGYTLISPMVALVGSAATILWSRSTFHSATLHSAVPGLFKAMILSGAVVYFSIIGITSKGLGATQR
jgi:hypothetical protein